MSRTNDSRHFTTLLARSAPGELIWTDLNAQLSDQKHLEIHPTEPVCVDDLIKADAPGWESRHEPA